MFGRRWKSLGIYVKVMALIMNEQKKLGTALALGVIIILGGLVWALMRTPSNRPDPAGKITFDSALETPSQGKQDAAVIVHLYSDFQCPACRIAEEPLAKTIEVYKDRVKFVWRDFPLMSIHPNARNAANAAWCANEQGKFWPFHDLLFMEQDRWAGESNPRDRFIDMARRFDLNVDQFTGCYNDRKYDNKVMAGVDEGNRNAVDRTPTVFINKKRAFGMSESEWSQALEKALADAAAVSSTTP